MDGTRPTMERVKESLFATIQNNVDDAVVLDLFSGSGNLGIEALSEGAKYAYLVDYNVKAAKTIKRNLDTIGITMVKSWTNLVGMTGMFVTSLVLALILVTVLISIILSILNVVNTINGIKLYNKDDNIEYLRKNTTHKIFLDIAYCRTG